MTKLGVFIRELLGIPVHIIDGKPYTALEAIAINITRQTIQSNLVKERQDIHSERLNLIVARLNVISELLTTRTEIIAERLNNHTIAINAIDERFPREIPPIRIPPTQEQLREAAEYLRASSPQIFRPQLNPDDRSITPNL